MTTISQTRITCSLFRTPMDLQRARYLPSRVTFMGAPPRRHGMRCCRRCTHDRDAF